MPMTVGRFVKLFAGTLVLLSLSLGAPASPVFKNQSWLWLATFVGFMLAQSAITGFCPMATVLRGLGVKTCATADE
jgi:hypothetical protein